MKYIIIFILFFLFVSCTKHPRIGFPPDEGVHCYQISDLRCDKFDKEAYDKGIQTGVCYSGNFKNTGSEGYEHPNPEACKALYAEADRKCDALPPPGPNDIVRSSGTTVYKDGKPVMKDGKPVCAPDKK